MIYILSAYIELAWLSRLLKCPFQYRDVNHSETSNFSIHYSSVHFSQSPGPWAGENDLPIGGCQRIGRGGVAIADARSSDGWG